jgi:transcriptional regulator with GAF, ATPase, and Fis domain
MVGKVADKGESQLANNVLAEPLYQPNPLLLDTQSEAVIPLHVGERTVGVIDIQSKDLNAFSQDDLSVLQSLADQIAIAIDTAGHTGGLPESCAIFLQSNRRCACCHVEIKDNVIPFVFGYNPIENH